MALCECLITSPPPQPNCLGNCLYVPDMLVQDDELTACSGASTIDISPVISNCGNDTVYYSIYSHNENVTNVSINSEYITFTPVNNNYEVGEIIYMVRCGMLSKTGTIIIVYKNNCTQLCDSGEICDKCTGDCEPAPPDLTTESSDPDLLT